VGLINAVLRRFQREREDCLRQLEKTEHQHAFPAWLLHCIQHDWPGDDWRRIVEESNQAAPLWLRLNQRRDCNQTTEALRQGGFEIESHVYAQDAIKLEPAAAVHDIPGFSEGLFSVQDPAAQLAADLLPVKDGDRVLDACCAPGGKTGHLLERYPGVQLTALDRSTARLAKVSENLERLGLAKENGLKLQAHDAARPEDWWDQKPFHFILLDAPCTATGVIRRHPEIKCLRSAQQLDSAVQAQRALLEALWPLLEPGGMLLYATCSILHAENRDQVQHFTDSHSDSQLQIIDAPWGRDTGFGRQILPGEHGMDGFFYALLTRKG
jgi:16S rRNA (cytosine967-C5)-methyltransferase